MHDGDTELLRLIHLFEPLSRQEIERVAEGIPVKVFERGRNVYNPAYRGDIFFLLLRGRVRVYRVEGRHEVTFAIVRGGEVFGEAAFAPRRRMGDYAEALETSRVGLMRREALARIIRRYPQVGVKAVELFSERLCADQERIVSLSCKKVPSRLAALILDLARDEGVETPEGRNIPTSNSPP
ncbi:MAG: Crp/Fnr family transcriptional regulator [Rubrobacteraceae bacterium]